MSVEENKQLALRFMEAMITGRREQLAEMVTDDAVFFYWGDFWFSGRMTPDEYFTKILKATDGKMAAGNSASGAPYLEMHIGEIIAEGDRVCVEGEDWIPLPDGTMMNPQFVVIFKMRDNKICEFKDYVDSHHLHLALTGKMRAKRDSNIFEVSHVIKGGGVAES